MQSHIIILLVLATLEALLIVALMKIAHSKKILLDIPNNRSSHHKATPKVGGIAIFFLLSCSAIIYPEFLTYHLLSVFAILLVFTIGVVDDFLDLSPYPKFFVMIISSLMVIYDGYTISSLGTYFGTATTLGILTIPFTVFAIVGFTNAMNLIDGLDGLSGSVSAVILAGFTYIGYIHNDITVLYLSSILLLGVIIFLLFNLNPAKIFLGDSGALLVGFTVSIIGVKLLDYISPTSVFFLTGIPILDTLYVMVNRVLNKKSPFKADKTHLHHNILRHTQDAKKTVQILALSQVMFTLIGLSLMNNDDMLNLSIFITIYALFFVMLRSSKSNKLS